MFKLYLFFFSHSLFNVDRFIQFDRQYNPDKIVVLSAYVDSKGVLPRKLTSTWDLMPISFLPLQQTLLSNYTYKAKWNFVLTCFYVFQKDRHEISRYIKTSSWYENKRFLRVTLIYSVTFFNFTKNVWKRPKGNSNCSLQFRADMECKKQFTPA